MKSINKKRNTVASDRFLSEDSLPKTLHEVLCDPDLVSEFMSYLKTKMADETLRFYQDIERFENISDQEMRDIVGKRIVEKYVEEESRYWVNLGATTRVQLCDLTTFTPESFQSAKGEVYQLMASNFFHKFIKHIGEESKRAKKSSSVITFSDVLGQLNLVDADIDDCGCGTDDCEVRRQRLQSTLRRSTRLGSVSSSMINLLLGSRASLTESVRNNPERRRTRNVFLRLFKKKDSQPSDVFEE